MHRRLPLYPSRSTSGAIRRGLVRLRGTWWLLPSIVLHLLLLPLLAWWFVESTGEVGRGARRARLVASATDEEAALAQAHGSARGELEVPRGVNGAPSLPDEVEPRCEPELVDTEEEILDGVPTENVTDSNFDKDQFNDVIGIGGGAGGHGKFSGRFGRGRAGLPRYRHGGLPPGTWKRSARRPSFARVYIGGGNSLDLVKMRITVTIDGPRARTVVDHIFRNPHDRQLEGTFEYPLPAGASPCYYGMFLSNRWEETPAFFTKRTLLAIPAAELAEMEPGRMLRRVEKARWGKLREARAVTRDRGRQVYEQIVRRRIDPALLEYAGPNLFRGRVYPIPPRGYSRVIIAYEEHLPLAEGRQLYRFPLPDCALERLEATLTVPLAGFAGTAISGVDRVEKRGGEERVTYSFHREGAGPGGEVLLACTPRQPDLQVISGPEEYGLGRCFYARFRPSLPAAAAAPFARRAVFLLDTSFSEHPDRFNTSLGIMREILEQDSRLRRFKVICFDRRARCLTPGGWVANDEAGRERLFTRLEGVLLEGATDLGDAFRVLAAMEGLEEGGPLGVFLLSDGRVNWGESRPGGILARLRRRLPLRIYCYRTGLGAENLALYRRLTAGGGGVFNVFSGKQARAAALAHRRPGLEVTGLEVTCGGKRLPDLVVKGGGGTIYPGGELVLAGRCPGLAGAVLVVKGRQEGKERRWRRELRLDGGSGLAARGWAEVVVARLLAAGRPELEPLAAAYAQRYNLATRVTSLLVLEADADYRRFGVNEESTRLEVRDLASFLADYAKTYDREESPAVRLRSFLETHFGGSDLLRGESRKRLERLLPLVEPAAPAPTAAALPREPASPLPVPRAYRESREDRRGATGAILAETDRRRGLGRPEAALRCLSTIVECNPGRSEAYRLVGYRLLAMEREGEAAHLLQRVVEQRPFEPHAYRTLAAALVARGRPAHAALLYEMILGHRWHRRFGTTMEEVAREEYARLMQTALKAKAAPPGLKEFFRGRLDDCAGDRRPADLRISITWNTDNTDVDLWVQEPDGTRCGYSHQETRNGGRLHEDLTQGYGPECYTITGAPPGRYTVLLHFFSPNPNHLAGETHAMVEISVGEGNPRARRIRRQVVLKQAKEWHLVAQVDLP